MDNDLFNDNYVPSDKISSIDPDKDYLEALVGEGKKFSSAEDLARGKAESDEFITQLLSEKQEVEDKLRESVTIEMLMEQLKTPTPVSNIENANMDQSNQNTPNLDENNPANSKNDSLTSERITELVEQKLQERTTQSTREANLTKVNNTLRESFGDKASEILRTLSQDNGMSIEALKEMACTSPQVVLNLAQQKVPKEEAPKQADLFANTSPRSTNVDTRQNNPASGVKNKAYYQQMRKTDRAKYHSPEIIAEEHRQAIALGDEFYN